MSGTEFDALLAHEETPWRPSMAFLATLSERLDDVDAEIERERERIPLDGARADDSVLFSVDAFGAGRAGPPTRLRARGEGSGIIDLARLPPRAPEPLDSGPLAVGQEVSLARRRTRLGLWLAAAGFVITAAGAALSPPPDATPAPTAAPAPALAAAAVPAPVSAPTLAPSAGRALASTPSELVLDPVTGGLTACTLVEVVTRRASPPAYAALWRTLCSARAPR